MTFDLRKAMRNLDIEVKRFGYGGEGIPDVPQYLQDGCRGYSLNRFLAVRPDERWPEFVSLHEMTHILLGHTKLHEKFGVSLEDASNGIVTPAIMQMKEYKQQHNDLMEAECHMTAILAAKMTGIPFDIDAEMTHLYHAYARGRDIPMDVMRRAYQTAQTIARAGAA